MEWIGENSDVEKQLGREAGLGDQYLIASRALQRDS